MAATLRDISQQTGVSLMTVSRALRGMAGVSDAVREQVRATARDLGYIGMNHVVMPTSLARGSRDAVMNCMIPLYIQAKELSDANQVSLSGYSQEVAAGVADRLKAVGGQVDVVPAESWQDVDEAFLTSKPDVVILRDRMPMAWVERLRQRACVVSAIASDLMTDVDCVSPNEMRAAAQIQRHLNALGHEQIAWLGINDHIKGGRGREGGDLVDRFFSTNTPRHAAWQLFCGLEPRAFNHKLVLIERDYRRCSQDAAVARGLARLFDRRGKPPTALVVSTLYLFEKVLEQLTQRGLHVPRDVSLVGYGIASEYEHFPAARQWTHICLPMYRIGQCLPEIAERRLANPEAEPISVQIQGTLVAGQTTATPG